MNYIFKNVAVSCKRYPPSLPYIIIVQTCGKRWDLPKFVDVLSLNLGFSRLLIWGWKKNTYNQEQTVTNTQKHVFGCRHDQACIITVESIIYIYRHIQVGRGVDDFCVSLAWRQALCGPSNLQACLRNLEQHLLRALLFERSLEDVSESFTCPICCLESEHISRSARTLMVREGDSLIQEI